MKFQEKVLNFVYDHQISICIGFGMIGFMLSVIMFTNRNGEIRNEIQDTPYGEIIISNKDSLIYDLLEKRTSRLNDSLIKLDADLQKKESKGNATSEITKVTQHILQYKNVIQNTVNEYNLLKYGPSDSAFRIYTKYIHPNKKEYLDSLNSTWGNNRSQVKKVSATIIDDCALIKPAIEYPAKIELMQNKRAVLMSFMTDYPQFGLWLVLTIAQMTLWFLLFPLLTGNLLDLKLKLGPQYYGLSLGKIATNCVLPLVFMGMFSFFFFYRLADNYVITDGYFFTNYNSVMKIYGLIGYGLAVYCFGTYLSLAEQVIIMDTRASEMNITRQNTDLNDKYLHLVRAFDNAFLASAIVLSFFVLWSGVTIESVNNTEAIKFYNIISGKNMIPSDFIYLLGLLHTCILLIFYLPIKLKFNSLPIVVTPHDQKNKSILKEFGSFLSAILVTTSPLIASFVQHIFEMLTN